jgi:hypothetical protein
MPALPPVPALPLGMPLSVSSPQPKKAAVVKKVIVAKEK